MTLKHALLATVTIAVVSPSLAHPGRGIVVDAQGTVYVSDAVRSVVWKISLDGVVTPAARDVHAHWLSIDANGRVLADNLRFDAETNTYPRGLVRLEPSSPPEHLIAVRPDPEGLDAGAFCATPDGFAVARESTNSIEQRREDGTKSSTPLGSSDKTVNALTRAAEGTLIAVRGRQICRLASTGEETRAVRVAEDTTTPRVLGLRDLWGVAVTNTGMILTTDPGSRRVLQVDANDKATTVHTSTAPWFPTGVACRDLTIYVLEHGLDGDQNLGPRVLVLEPRSPPRELATVDNTTSQ